MADVVWQIKRLLPIVIPGDEEDPAFLAILLRHKIKIINSVTALVGRKAGRKFLVALDWLSHLFHDNLPVLLLDLENDEAVSSFGFQFQESQLTIIMKKAHAKRVAL